MCVCVCVCVYIYINQSYVSYSCLLQAGFDWDKNIQGQILGSFFYGYLVLQIPGGMLSERFGAARVVTIGMIPVAVLTLLTPILTRVHYVILLVIRVVLGLGEVRGRFHELPPITQSPHSD